MTNGTEPRNFTPRQTITTALDVSGLSARAFAEYLLGRDEKTFREWRNGVGDDHQPPRVVVRWCARFLRLSPERRRKVVVLLAGVEREAVDAVQDARERGNIAVVQTPRVSRKAPEGHVPRGTLPRRWHGRRRRRRPRK
jgi:hypothetical protein